MGGLIHSAVPIRSPQVESIDMDGDVLLYDGSNLRLLAGTAAIIWRAIDGATDAGGIAMPLAQASPDPLRVSSEVNDFLEHLIQLGVVDVDVDLQPPEPAYARPDYVGFTHNSSALLLVNLRDGRRRALSATGARVWQLVIERHRTSLVVDALRAEYDGDAVALAHDVDALLRALVQDGFLLRRDASTAPPAEAPP